jgi:hypothetical protein
MALLVLQSVSARLRGRQVEALGTLCRLQAECFAARRFCVPIPPTEGEKKGR